MTDTELLQWAEHHQWTGLVLSHTEILKRGEPYWRELLIEADNEKRERVEKRIERWNEWEEKVSA
jgi:hypothetical protein